jgi:hypothetical protein
MFGSQKIDAAVGATQTLSKTVDCFRVLSFWASVVGSMGFCQEFFMDVARPGDKLTPLGAGVIN